MRSNVLFPFTKKPRSAIEASDRWFVLLDGEPVAMLSNPQDADMFWFTWDVHAIGATFSRTFGSIQMIHVDRFDTWRPAN